MQMPFKPTFLTIDLPAPLTIGAAAPIITKLTVEMYAGHPIPSVKVIKGSNCDFSAIDSYISQPQEISQSIQSLDWSAVKALIATEEQEFHSTAQTSQAHKILALTLKKNIQKKHYISGNNINLRTVVKCALCMHAINAKELEPHRKKCSNSQ